MKPMLSFLIAGLFAIVGALPAQENNQPKGKFSGYMFGDYYYNVARDPAFAGSTPLSKTALANPKDMQGFQFRRIYFTYDNDISDQFTSRFRLEADQSALTTGSSTSVLTSATTLASSAKLDSTLTTKSANAGSYQGKITVFVKDAYLKWKNLFEGSDLIFGIQPTTAYDISETWWSYRSLEKTIMDLRGIIPSRDFGVALRGKITSDGMFNYWAMIANGDGNSPASTQFKRYSLNLQVKPNANWQATLNGDYRAQANIDDINSTSNPKATVSNNVFTGALFLGYKEADKYSVGLEGFMQSAANGYTDRSTTLASLTGLNAMGISVWGSVNFQPDLALILRYDYYDPNTNSNSKGDSRNYVIGGVSWKPDKNVSIMPNIQVETYEAPTSGTTPDASITGRVTVYYIFL